MADVSAVDAGRESRRGAGAGAFLLTVIGSNVALGAFLWLVMDARFNSMETRFASIESRLTSIESRLSNIENVLISGAGAPAPDTEER